MSDPVPGNVPDAWPKARYPSGAEMPRYGPTTSDEQIVDALEWAHAMLLARDEMNAAVHCSSLRISDVTVKVAAALGIARLRLPPVEFLDE